MNNNQLHGKKFEDMIKAFAFPGASDAGRPSIALFDVEARFDREFGLPTSIKATGYRSIGLADARRFWAIDQSFRLMVGQYKQENGLKIFTIVYEIIIKREMLNIIRGKASIAMISEIHDGISVNAFPRGCETQARAWARAQVAAIAPECGIITLNPKIDTKGQRRLQCSARLDRLEELTRSYPQACMIHKHTEKIGDLPLPVSIISGRRLFRR